MVAFTERTIKLQSGYCAVRVEAIYSLGARGATISITIIKCTTREAESFDAADIAFGSLGDFEGHYSGYMEQKNISILF